MKNDLEVAKECITDLSGALREMIARCSELEGVITLSLVGSCTC